LRASHFLAGGDGVNKLPSKMEAIKLLMESGCSPGVILHSLMVAQVASDIADACRRRGLNVDLQLVEVGALLHDIGRSKTSTVDHGLVGAEMLRSLGLPEPVALIAERHVGCGLPKSEAEKLGWPNKSYLPETLEEKIVAYADKLVEGGRRLTIKEAIRKLKKKMGPDHPSIHRMLRLHRELTQLLGKEEDEGHSP